MVLSYIAVKNVKRKIGTITIKFVVHLLKAEIKVKRDDNDDKVNAVRCNVNINLLVVDEIPNKINNKCGINIYKIIKI